VPLLHHVLSTLGVAMPRALQQFMPVLCEGNVHAMAAIDGKPASSRRASTAYTVL